MLLLKTLLHTLLLPCTVAVWVPLLLLGERRRTPPEWGALGLAGAAVGLLCLAVFVWCTYDFIARGRGTPNPLDPPKVVVATGPYRWVRNPMYVSATLFILAGAALYRSATLALYAACVLTGFHLFVTLYEEPSLRRRFGRSYEDYCRRVPRWLPRAPREAE
jgi:protein-S-isoprenylcysteine O-methyltransferase Ste14